MPYDVDGRRHGHKPPDDSSDAGMDNDYQVTVVATEVLKADQMPPAESESLDVTVMVNNVEEPGTITLDRLQV